MKCLSIFLVCFSRNLRQINSIQIIFENYFSWHEALQTKHRENQERIVYLFSFLQNVIESAHCAIEPAMHTGPKMGQIYLKIKLRISILLNKICKLFKICQLFQRKTVIFGALNQTKTVIIGFKKKLFLAPKSEKPLFLAP